ncbi:MAG: GTP-binding protein [Thermoplasmata archaeon]
MRVIPQTPEGPNPPRVGVKLCLVGDPTVGKTCLATRYVFRRHVRRYQQTYRARIYRKRLRADFGDGGQGMLVDLELWDAPGNPTLFSVLHDVYFHRADGVLIACDGTRPQSMRNVPFWIKVARHAVSKADTRILVNKADRLRGRQPLGSMPQMARSLNAPWALVSAATGQNVDGAFTGLIGEALLRRWPAAYRGTAGPATPAPSWDQNQRPNPYGHPAPLIPR